MKEKHQFTKDEARKLLTLWDTKTLREIALELNIGINQVVYLAQAMRRAGFKLGKKHKVGQMRNMLVELLAEQKGA